MRSLGFTLLGTLTLISFTAQAETNPCSAYFQQDIHNKLVVIDNKTNKQVATSSLCQNSAESLSSGFSVEYAGVGVGFDQARALAKAMCDNKFSQSDFESSNSVYSSIVDPNILQAANECFKLNARGLHYDVHSDADTHSVTISMLYDGPTSISITDIVLDGNAKCEGGLFSEWSAKSKKLPLDTRTRALTCVPKDPIDPKSSGDLSAGSITLITDAGPIYAQIPRRFSPTLEKQFADLNAQVASLQKEIAVHQDLLKYSVLATAIVSGNKLIYNSSGLTFDENSGTITFPNPKNLAFVPLITDAQQVQFITSIAWIQKITPPNQIIVLDNSLDTAGYRTYPPVGFTLVILAAQ